MRAHFLCPRTSWVLLGPASLTLDCPPWAGYDKKVWADNPSSLLLCQKRGLAHEGSFSLPQNQLGTFGPCFPCPRLPSLGMTKKWAGPWGVIFSARFWCHGTTLSWVFIHARFVNVKRGHKVAQFTSQQHLIILIRNAHNELKKFVKLQHYFAISWNV